MGGILRVYLGLPKDRKVPFLAVGENLLRSFWLEVSKLKCSTWRSSRREREEVDGICDMWFGKC